MSQSGKAGDGGCEWWPGFIWWVRLQLMVSDHLATSDQI